jgi:hypothetical protein
VSDNGVVDEGFKPNSEFTCGEKEIVTVGYLCWSFVLGDPFNFVGVCVEV